MDQVFLDEGKILIDATKVKIGTFTYPLRNITSYRRLKLSGTIFTILPMLLGLVLAALAISTQDKTLMAIGIAVLTFGMVRFFMSETLYLTTSAGEVRAFSTVNRAKMQRVASALDAALSTVRG